MSERASVFINDGVLIIRFDEIYYGSVCEEVSYYYDQQVVGKPVGSIRVKGKREIWHQVTEFDLTFHRNDMIELVSKLREEDTQKVEGHYRKIFFGLFKKWIPEHVLPKPGWVREKETVPFDTCSSNWRVHLKNRMDNSNR